MSVPVPSCDRNKVSTRELNRVRKLGEDGHNGVTERQKKKDVVIHRSFFSLSFRFALFSSRPRVHYHPPQNHLHPSPPPKNRSPHPPYEHRVRRIPSNRNHRRRRIGIRNKDIRGQVRSRSEVQVQIQSNESVCASLVLFFCCCCFPFL